LPVRIPLPWAIAALAGCAAAERDPTSEQDASPDVEASVERDGASENVSVVGTVDGRDLNIVDVLSGILDRYTFVGTRVDSRHIEVALNSFVDTCGSVTSVGTTIYLDLFQNPMLPDSVVTEPGTFDVWLPELRSAEIPRDKRVIASYVRVGAQGGMSFLAVSGYVNVTTITDAELSGELALQFENGAVSGSFVSARCAEWNRAASIPSPK
jgi:hypothetical protein